MNETLNAIELATYLRIHYRTLIDLLKTDYKDMPKTKKGASWEFNKEEVMKFIEERFN